MFDAQLHDADGVREFLVRLSALIAATIADPDRPLGELHRSTTHSDRSDGKPPRFYVLNAFKVAEFVQWKHGFDRDSLHRRRGAEGHEVLRSVAIPDVVFVRTAFPSALEAAFFRELLLRRLPSDRQVLPPTALQLIESETYELPP